MTSKKSLTLEEIRSCAKRASERIDRERYRSPRDVLDYLINSKIVFLLDDMADMVDRARLELRKARSQENKGQAKAKIKALTEALKVGLEILKD